MQERARIDTTYFNEIKAGFKKGLKIDHCSVRHQKLNCSVVSSFKEVPLVSIETSEVTSKNCILQFPEVCIISFAWIRQISYSSCTLLASFTSLQ